VLSSTLAAGLFTLFAGWVEVVRRWVFGVERLPTGVLVFLVGTTFVLVCGVLLRALVAQLNSGPHTEQTTLVGRSAPGGGHGFTVTWACSEMQGWRDNMEDAHIALTVVKKPEDGEVEVPDNNMMLFAVFDGHGGSAVSQLCARWMPTRVAELMGSPDLKEKITQMHVEMDKQLRKVGQDKAVKHPPQQTKVAKCFPLLAAHPFEPNSFSYTGCTAVSAYIVGNKVYVANVGDSRTLLCRNGKCVELSQDHKPNNPEEKRRIEAAGGRVQVIGPCARVDLGLNLSRALGDFAYKNPAAAVEDQKICVIPDILEADLKPGDEFLVVACDGIFELFENQQVIDFVRPRLADHGSPEKAVRELLSAACSPDPQSTQGLGMDNETAIIVQLHWPGQAA